MKIEYAVSFPLWHTVGGNFRAEDPRFDTYEKAQQHAQENCDSSYLPDIYLVLNDKYVFNTVKHPFEDKLSKISRIVPIDGGYITTEIFWENFQKDPEKYLFVADIVLENTT